jgi:hypothetical protein
MEQRAPDLRLQLRDALPQRRRRQRHRARRCAKI